MPVYIEWSRSSKAGLNFRAAYEFIKDTYCGYHTTTKPEGEVNGGDLASSGLKLNQYYQQKCTWILNSVTDRQVTIEVRSTQNRKNNYFSLYIFFFFKFLDYKANFHSILEQTKAPILSFSQREKKKYIFLDYSCILVLHTIQTCQVSSSNFSILAHLNRDPPIHRQAIQQQIKGGYLPTPRFVPFPAIQRRISFNSSLGYSAGISIRAIEPGHGREPNRKAAVEGTGLNRKEKRKRKKVRLRKRGWTSRTNGRQDWRLKRPLDDAGQRWTKRELVFKDALASLSPSISFFCPCSLVFSGFPSTSFRAEKQTRERGKETKLLQRSQKRLSHIGLFLSRVFFYSLGFFSKSSVCFRSQLSISNGSNLINYRSSWIIFNNSISFYW